MSSDVDEFSAVVETAATVVVVVVEDVDAAMATSIVSLVVEVVEDATSSAASAASALAAGDSFVKPVRAKRSLSLQRFVVVVVVEDDAKALSSLSHGRSASASSLSSMFRR